MQFRHWRCSTHLLVLLVLLTVPPRTLAQRKPARDAKSAGATVRYAPAAGSTVRYRQIEKTRALAQSNDGRAVDIDRTTTRYLTLRFESVTARDIVYLFTQDTALVEDDAEDDGSAVRTAEMQNLLTRKPVRVRMTPLGEMLAVEPTVPLGAGEKLGEGASDALWARQAMIFPRLPDRPLAEGDEWTEARSDTLHPTRTIPGLGKGSGDRTLRTQTRYSVGAPKTVDERRCVSLTWTVVSGLEEAVFYPTLEEYQEDQSTSTTTALIEEHGGLPRSIRTNTSQESTRAVFGGQNSVVPTSLTTELTLEMLPH